MKTRIIKIAGFVFVIFLMNTLVSKAQSAVVFGMFFPKFATERKNFYTFVPPNIVNVIIYLKPY